MIKFKIISFFTIAPAILVSDQWTKLWAMSELKGGRVYAYWNGLIRLVYAENTGAWGNLAGDWHPILRYTLLFALPSVVLIGLAIYLFYTKKITRLEVLAYSFIFAGGVGNVADRFRLNYVVDFMWMGIEGSFLQTNIFNIADLSIVIGGLMILWLSFKNWLAKKKSQSEENS